MQKCRSVDLARLQELRQVVEEAIPLLRGSRRTTPSLRQLELRPQAMHSPELRPLGSLLIALRERTDVAIPLPSPPRLRPPSSVWLTQ